VIHRLWVRVPAGHHCIVALGCELTAKKLGSSLSPTLIIKYGTTVFYFFQHQTNHLKSTKDRLEFNIVAFGTACRLLLNCVFACLQFDLRFDLGQ